MVISVLTICLVPKLQLGNAVPRSYASPALRLPYLNTCLGGHLNAYCVGKRSFRSVRPQAGTWERGFRRMRSQHLTLWGEPLGESDPR